MNDIEIIKHKIMTAQNCAPDFFPWVHLFKEVEEAAERMANRIAELEKEKNGKISEDCKCALSDFVVCEQVSLLKAEVDRLREFEAMYKGLCK